MTTDDSRPLSIHRLSIHRRHFIAGLAGASAVPWCTQPVWAHSLRKAQISITLDLEMSRHYPKRGMMEWDYQKGNLDAATKAYTLKAASTAEKYNQRLHLFLVGRVLEQENILWLQQLIERGHAIGNHTYDHVNLLARTAGEAQFRFRRAPWLARNKKVNELLRDNIAMTTTAMKKRLGISPNGFRTPGGFYMGLSGRPDLQKMLLDLGFKWVSSKYPRHLSGKPKERPGEEVYQSIQNAQKEAQPFVYPSGLIEIPMSPISDVTAFRSNFWKLDYFLKAVRTALNWVVANGAVFDFLAHPSCLVVEDPECQIVDTICRYVAERKDQAEIVDLSKAADRIAASIKK